MANLNKVFLIGNLTRDVDLRYSPTGVAVARMGLAVNRYYQGQDGEKKEETCFVDVVAFGKTAEICNTYLSKGKQVFFEGRLSFRTWETPEGEKRNKLEVIAERMQFIGWQRPEEEKILDEEIEGNESEDDIPF
ncbi:MAG: single-stranded DNA-binding protein [Candidatus Poribacteria bacterium]